MNREKVLDLLVQLEQARNEENMAWQTLYKMYTQTHEYTQYALLRDRRYMIEYEIEQARKE